MYNKPFQSVFSCSNCKGKLKYDARWIKKYQANQVPQCRVDRFIDPLQWQCFCCSAHCVTTCNKIKLLLDFLHCILSLEHTDMPACVFLCLPPLRFARNFFVCWKTCLCSQETCYRRPQCTMYRGCLSCLPIEFFCQLIAYQYNGKPDWRKDG